MRGRIQIGDLERDEDKNGPQKSHTKPIVHPLPEEQCINSRQRPTNSPKTPYLKGGKSGRNQKGKSRNHDNEGKDSKCGPQDRQLQKHDDREVTVRIRRDPHPEPSCLDAVVTEGDVEVAVFVELLSSLSGPHFFTKMCL